MKPNSLSNSCRATTYGHCHFLKSKRLIVPVLLATAFFFLKLSAFAAYPPVLVISGTAYGGVHVTAGGQDYFKYSTGSSVLILSGSTGGDAAIGANETAAVANLSAGGTWDGGLNVYVAGTTVVVP